MFCWTAALSECHGGPLRVGRGGSFGSCLINQLHSPHCAHNEERYICLNFIYKLKVFSLSNKKVNAQFFLFLHKCVSCTWKVWYKIYISLMHLLALSLKFLLIYPPPISSVPLQCICWENQIHTACRNSQMLNFVAHIFKTFFNMFFGLFYSL